jgi:hypothetical protein
MDASSVTSQEVATITFAACGVYRAGVTRIVMPFAVFASRIVTERGPSIFPDDRKTSRSDRLVHQHGRNVVCRACALSPGN